MRSHHLSVAALVGLVGLTGTTYGTITSCPEIPAARYTMNVAEGWSAIKVADGLTRPRGITLDNKGRLIVLESGSGISQHTVDEDGCIPADSSRMLLSRPVLNHGIHFSPDGLTLYASSRDYVWGWAYNPETGHLDLDSEAILVSGMAPSSHSTRTLAIPQSEPDLLVVSAGSDGNLDHASVSPEVARAIVKVFNISSVPEGGWNYVTDGWNAGYGLRNEVCLSFDGNDMLWGVENSADNAERTVNGTSEDIHTNNPAEELNYLGSVTKPNDNWYGYPTCFTVRGPDEITDTEFQIGEQYVLTPNATFDDSSCAEQAVPPRLTLPAHTAPLGSAFDATFENLYVALHGSWNRNPPQGYKLVAIPFTQGPDGAYEPVAEQSDPNGYTDILWHPNESSCSASTCTRPVGLVFDAAGRLYMESDATGEIFLLTKS